MGPSRGIDIVIVDTVVALDGRQETEVTMGMH